MIQPTRCEPKRGLKVFGLEIRQLFENLLLRQTGSEKIENIAHADPHATDTGPAAALLRIHCDSFSERVHEPGV